jgi:hypothetical protein
MEKNNERMPYLQREVIFEPKVLSKSGPEALCNTEKALGGTILAVPNTTVPRKRRFDAFTCRPRQQYPAGMAGQVPLRNKGQ